MNPDFQKAFEQAQSQQGSSMKFTEGMCWKILNKISFFFKNNFKRKRKSSRKPLMIRNSANFLLTTWTRCKVHLSLVSIHSPTSFPDPKHREETEEYIRQLEGEQKVPEGKELIR